MPLSTPVIALVGFFNFTSSWNNYFLPFVMLPGRKAPIQVGLAQLLSNVPQFNVTNAGSSMITLSTLALATLIAVAPVLIVFLFAQRLFLVNGMTAGGLQGMSVQRMGMVIAVGPGGSSTTTAACMPRPGRR